MTPYTDKDLQKWRTGLYAANPQQAKALVEELDEARALSVTRWVGPRGHHMMSGAFGGAIGLANGQWHIFAHFGDDPKVNHVSEAGAIQWCTTGRQDGAR